MYCSAAFSEGLVGGSVCVLEKGRKGRQRGEGEGGNGGSRHSNYYTPSSGMRQIREK